MAKDSLHGLRPASGRGGPPVEAAGRDGSAEAARVGAIMARFEAADPRPKAGLGREDPFQLLVTVLMSAQSTGPTVGRVAASLFAVAPTPTAMLALGRERIAELIKPVGLGANKSRHIVALSAMLLDGFGGIVPRSSAELQRFPGIGRKTADVVANFAFGEPVIGVDTHVFRVSNRMPLAPGPTPAAVADGLLAVVPDRLKDGAHVWLFRHGRDICTARRPACARCIVADLCAWPGKSGGADLAS